MKKLSLLAAVVVIVLSSSSCNRYTVSGAGCGVWYPKKYSGKAPKQRMNIRIPTM